MKKNHKYVLEDISVMLINGNFFYRNKTKAKGYFHNLKTKHADSFAKLGYKPISLNVQSPLVELKKPCCSYICTTSSEDDTVISRSPKPQVSRIPRVQSSQTKLNIEENETIEVNYIYPTRIPRIVRSSLQENSNKNDR